MMKPVFCDKVLSGYRFILLLLRYTDRLNSGAGPKGISMRFLTVILVLAGLFGAYRWWAGPVTGDPSDVTNQNGFVPVQMPDGAPQRSVLVLSPPNCPSDEAQRAEALAQHLTQQGIPVTRGNSISFDLMNPTAEQRAGVERAVAVFNGGAPAVFVNGMAMSNPTAAQTVAEYRRTRRGL